MMTCDECRELLSACADGEAGAEEAAAVSSHLEGCPGCRASLRVLRGLKEAVRLSPRPALPPDLREELLAQARRAGRPAIPFELLRGWSLAAACAAAGVLLLLRGAPEEDAVPLQAVLAAHERYALTLPLAPRESLLSELPDSLEESDGR